MDATTLSLDDMGILNGTNKSCLSSAYLRHYERSFADWRNRTFNLIEIGVHEGSSVQTFAEFFPNAAIVGLDINEDCRKYATDRITIEIGNQGDPGFLLRVCMAYPPSIIIDDGSHQARHVLFGFQTLFPLLAPGGVYVMEDLYQHYGRLADQFRKDVPVSPSEYMFAIGHDKLSGSVDAADNHTTRRYMVDHIDRFEVISQTIIVHKKDDRAARTLHEILPLVKQSNSGESWFLYGEALAKQIAALDEAIAAFRMAVQIQPWKVKHHISMARLLIRHGRREEAIAVLQEALGLMADQASRGVIQRHIEMWGKAGG